MHSDTAVFDLQTQTDDVPSIRTLGAVLRGRVVFLFAPTLTPSPFPQDSAMIELAERREPREPCRVGVR